VFGHGMHQNLLELLSRGFIELYFINHNLRPADILRRRTNDGLAK
jgi:hypothetical protein